MNVTIDRSDPVVVLQVNEPRMTFSTLAEFSDAAVGLITGGEPRLVVDLTAVNYVDSATIGCLMDLYRQASAARGALKLAGVQKRVETMLAMTGAHHFLEAHPDRAAAIASFRS